MTLNAGWVASHGLALLVGTLILFALYRFAQPLIHRLVVGLLHVQQAAMPAGTAPAEELQKRAVTLEDVLNRLIRALFLVSIVVLVLAVFDLWELVAGLGLFAAALTLAGQQIVLDYLMGLLILIEGPFFKGDWIIVQGTPDPVEGEVEEINLRRTVLRDPLGAMHSVSNGLVRVSSNLTRVYSIATVEVQIVRTADLDKAIAVARRGSGDRDRPRVGASPDPVAGRHVDHGADAGRRHDPAPAPRPAVGPAAATSELRRRLLEAFTAESIGTGRWDTPMPLAAPPPTAGT